MDPDPTCFIISLVAINYTIISCVFILIILLISSALISGAEVALFSLTKIDIKAEENPRKIQIISSLLEKPKKLLATILIANNFINIAIVILFAYLSEYILKDIVVLGFWLRFLIEVAIVSFLILLFGEILPKIYASRNRLKFSILMASPLKILDVMFSPISIPMRSTTIFIQNRFGNKKSNLSVDQLSQALELASSEDTTKEEQKILQGIVSFGNTDTKQVMQPRIDIFALNIEQKYVEIMPLIIEKGYSRIPVFQESIDSIKGILYVKDLLPYTGRKQFDWTTLLRAPLFVPENKKLDNLMEEFQDKKVHLAVVVDEYGGTSGIISLEDIIEQIVGDINDEFDDDDLIYSKLDDNNYVFEGKTPLKDIYRIIKIEDESVFEDLKGEAETIAGFVLEISKSFPKRNSKINFKNYVFTIEALDKKRLKRIKVSIT